MKTIFCRLLILMFIATAFTAFAGGGRESGAEAERTPEQVLRYAATSDFKDFHTAIREGGGPAQVTGILYDGLASLPGTLDELRAGDYLPSLAESWELSDDGRTWTFHLREGVQFHHGYGEVTAEDVAFTYGEVNTDPAWGVNVGAYEELEIDVVDKYTVSITTPVPNANFLILVSNVAGGNIISKRAYDERGMQGYKSHPVGTGAFEFIEHIPNEIVLLERHDDYYKGRPILERIEFLPMHVNSAELALRRGEVQFLNSGIEQSQWIERMRGFGIEPIPIYRESIMILMIDQEVEPLDDIRVRRAIHHAINKQDLVSLFGADLVREMKGPVPDTFFGATEEVPQYEYDPEKSRRLLAEAGYPDGFTLEVISTERRTVLDTFTVIQDQLAQVGIEIDLSVHPHSTWHELMRSGHGHLNIRATGRLPFADIILTENFHGDAIVTRPTGIRNMMNYDNDLVNRNIEAARFETDRDKLRQLYKEALTQIMEDAVAVPLLVRASVVARHPKFDPGYDLEGIYEPDPRITIDHRARIIAE